jgi:hypothetical protein
VGLDLKRYALAALLAATGAAAAAGDPAAPYLGRWDLTLQTPQRAYSSWLEVRQEHGQLKARMVGRWGSVRELPQVAVRDGHLRFVSPKEEEGRERDDMAFDAVLSGAQLLGTTAAEDGTLWTWRGVRAPALAPRKHVRWGRPVTLFTGRDLSGWQPLDAAAKPWSVADGRLLSPGHGTDLYTSARYGDFKLHLEFLCPPGANSGVYLRGRYEVQIEDDAVPEQPNQRTAGVYGYLAPQPAAARQPGVWQSYDITLVGRHVTVLLNGKTVIDHQPIPGITGGAIDSDEAAPGPILLQGVEEGRVAYRNIVLTPAR